MKVIDKIVGLVAASRWIVITPSVDCPSSFASKAFVGCGERLAYSIEERSSALRSCKTGQAIAVFSAGTRRGALHPGGSDISDGTLFCDETDIEDISGSPIVVWSDSSYYWVVKSTRRDVLSLKRRFTYDQLPAEEEWWSRWLKEFFRVVVQVAMKKLQKFEVYYTIDRMYQDCMIGFESGKRTYVSVLLTKELSKSIHLDETFGRK